MSDASALIEVSRDRRWTVDDLDGLPEGYRYELIGGALYRSGLPVWPYPGVITNLSWLLGSWVRRRHLGWVLGPRSGLYLDRQNLLDPNLVYLRREDTPRVGAWPSSTPLAIEVVPSPEGVAPPSVREFVLRRLGTRELWYVNHAEQTLVVKCLQEDGYRVTDTFRPGDTVTTAELPGLGFPLSAVFADL